MTIEKRKNITPLLSGANTGLNNCCHLVATPETKGSFYIPPALIISKANKEEVVKKSFKHLCLGGFVESVIFESGSNCTPRLSTCKLERVDHDAKIRNLKIVIGTLIQ